MRLSILLFDGFTTLDAIGGYEVLSRIPGIEVEFFARDKGIIPADTTRLGLYAWKSFEDIDSTDILYVPGGPGAYPLEQDESVLEKIRQLDVKSTWTVGVCNGVGVLGAAGLLFGREVTTNWFYRERVAKYGAHFIPKRHHQSDKYITAAGVSASIDMALFLAEIIANKELAQTIQLGLEYYPNPPFPEKTPEEAPDYAVQIISNLEKDAAAGPENAKTPPWLI